MEHCLRQEEGGFGWYCSLVKGHSGRHEAYPEHDTTRTRLSTWGAQSLVLPQDAKARKTYPITTGVLDYFPDAIAAIALVSYLGNEQHNPGEPLHWAREKSTDHEDAMLRHFMARKRIDTDGIRHTARMAWRALAILQLELEEIGQ